MTSVPGFISFSPVLPAEPAVLVPTTPRDPHSLNVVLHPTDDPEWESFWMPRLAAAPCWGRKIPGARFQYAHLMAVIGYHRPMEGPRGQRVLVAGAYEDPVYEILQALDGCDVVGIDPELNGMDLLQGIESGFLAPDSFDTVIAASVLEHTEKDWEFLCQALHVLKPGGIFFATCDFQSGWQPGMPLAPTQRRMYSEASLAALAYAIKDQVTPYELDDDNKGPRHGMGKPNWYDRGNYFSYAGLNYAFASFSFQKALMEEIP